MVEVLEISANTSSNIARDFLRFFHKRMSEIETFTELHALTRLAQATYSELKHNCLMNEDEDYEFEALADIAERRKKLLAMQEGRPAVSESINVLAK
jgi:hypothetical protein